MKVNNLELKEKEEGYVKLFEIPIAVTVDKNSFLHIGASSSPLTEKKQAIFKVERTPVIPASSFKGALRNQLEILFIEKKESLKKVLNIYSDDLIKPCIPDSRPSKAEKSLLKNIYRGEIQGKKYIGHCEINIDENNVDLPKISNVEIGICPVCYFMGCTGIMGFLRISNLFPKQEGNIIDQTNIRIDRKTGTSASGQLRSGEQVIPGTIFKGEIEVIIKSDIVKFEFGHPRKIGDVVIDKWLINWNESDIEKRKEYLVNSILIPAIKNIKELGGWKSKGGGIVSVDIKQ
ncbi:MAG: RAMP superfamily CRISPR-associated protein [Promethearchaeota archaeon]